MLYLIRSFYRDIETNTIKEILKIGYASEVDRRLGDYYPYNPGLEVISTREGDYELEQLFHKYFDKYKYEVEDRNFREWFYYDEEIINGFENLTKNDIICTDSDPIKRRKRKMELFNRIKSIVKHCSFDKIASKKDLDEYSEIILNNLNLSIEVTESEILDCIEKIYGKQSLNNYYKFKNTILDDPELENIINTANTYTIFDDKVKYLCDSLEGKSSDGIDIVLLNIDNYIANYFNILGIKRIRNLYYQRSKLDKEVTKIINNQDIDIRNIIYSNFNEGDRIPKSIIKEKLKELYIANNYSKSPKATDLEDYFEVKYINFMHQGKKTHGLELLKKKL